MKMVRKKIGLTLAETVATMAVMVPIFILVVMAVTEVSEAYRIKQGLSQAARQAARDLAAAYAQSKLVDGSKSLQDSMVFSKVVVDKTVTSSTQFDPADFDTESTPKSVKVTVRYISNDATGLPKFPSFDPIHLGSNFQLTADATYSLD